jgi:hypothetical protein
MAERHRWTGGVVIIVLLGLLGSSAAVCGQVPLAQTCLILSAETGLALTVADAEAASLADIVVQPANGGAHQCWRLMPDRYGDAVAIVSLKSGLVVDVMGYSKRDGANVQQFRDFGSRNQRWRLTTAGADRYRLTARHSDKCMTVPSGGAGVSVQQAACPGGDGALWKILPYPHSDKAYRIFSRQSGKALDVEGKSKEDGANIQIFHATGGPNQLWTLFPDGESEGRPVYSIISHHSGSAVDVHAADTGDGANVQQHVYNGGDNQRWRLVPAAGDGYSFISINSGMCLDVKGEETADGTNVQQARCNGGDNQIWRLSPESIVPGQAGPPR